MDILAALFEVGRHYGGLVTTSQAESIGVADQRLSDLARCGAISRVAHGVYAVAPDGADEINPVAIATAHNVALSYESAAAWCGADLPRPPRIVHATASRNRGRRSDSISGAQLHRADLAAHEVHTMSGVRVTVPLRTALDIARSRSVEDAVAIVDSLMRATPLRAEEFILAASRLKGPGRTKALTVATLINEKSGSILESFTRVLMWRHGLPDPVAQYSFTHPSGGWIGYMDFAWPEFRAILECDGYEYHASRDSFQKDRRRWTAVSGSRWNIAVVTWFDVTCDPEYVVAAVHDLLAA